MRTYLDESGTFAGIGEPFSPSVVGALVIPDCKYAGLMRQYRRLRRSLPKEGSEVKGRLLCEREVSQVVNLLRVSDCLFFANFIELGLHSQAGIERHRAGTAAGMISNLTSKHHPSTHLWAAERKLRIEKVSLQLYVQAVATTDLLARVLNEATCYFVQRHPGELGRFEWIIDAKGDSGKLTKWEDLWTSTLKPHLQSYSLREPMIQIVGADYSHFGKFLTKTPDHLLPHIPNAAIAGDPTDLRKIFETMRITSDPDHELELVDITTNSLRRAFKNTLGQEGRLPLRSLMINRRYQCITVMDLEGTQSAKSYPLHYRRVLAAFRHGGRSMVPGPRKGGSSGRREP